MSEEEKIIRNWAIYQDMVGKNGIIKIVLKRALPILNNEISRLLNGLCDFNVEISVSDDNKVCMDFTVYDEILDGVAVSNYDNVKELFNRMTKSYDFIIHITHNEMISDWHNGIITVTKDKNGISVIELNDIKANV